MEKGSEWFSTAATRWGQTLGRDQGRAGGSATPGCSGSKSRQKKRRERKDGTKASRRRQAPHIRRDFSQKHPGLPTSSPSDPSEQEWEDISPPGASRPARSTAKPSMASSSPACSNTLAGMCYSTGQGACQQHANTPGDPPFQVGKTRLCSSTHSLPPTADTHTRPSTATGPGPGLGAPGSS